MYWKRTTTQSKEARMTTTPAVRRDGASLMSELMSWFGNPPTQPEIRVEEYQEGERRIIRADLPGVDPRKDIALTVENGRLRLRGQRRAEEHDRYRTEIRYGSFERMLTLPADTEPEDITAEYVNGVLTVSMPAATQTTPQEIPVTHRELPVE
jgi:HSP20 family protein